MVSDTTSASDTANLDSYSLCEVYWEGYGRIVCEGFKFSMKLKAEEKKDCGQINGYDWDLSDFQYTWEITEPADYEFFDERFFNQIYDKNGLTITGYAQDKNGNWVKKDTFQSCIITDTGRDYGTGIKRTIKGSALAKVTDSANIKKTNASTSLATN